MANQFAIVFVVALAAASSLGVQSNTFDSLKNRFNGGNFLRRSYRGNQGAMRPMYPTTGYIPSSPYVQHTPYNHVGGGGAAAAAAASGSGLNGRSASAAASAAPGAASSSASIAGGRGYGTPRTTGYNREYNYGDARNDYTVNGAPVSGAYDFEPEYSAPAPVAPPKPMKPVKPVMNFETFKAPIYESYKARPVYDNGYRSGGSAAAAAAAGGNAAAAAAATGGHANVRYNPDGYESNYAAASGAYTGDLSGYESSGYKRGTEHLIDHESGHKDDNHEYKAQSFGKNDNESKKEKYKKKHKDLEVTPTVYRLSKSSEEYEGDYKKDGSESGSSVMAKDKTSSGFKKDSNKFVETVDKFHNRNGNDIMANTDRHSVHRVNNEDEEYFDTDGIYPGAPVGRSGGGAAASSAASGGYGSAAAAAAAGGH